MVSPEIRPGIVGIAAGFALMFLCGVAYSYGVAMPAIQETFGLSKAKASLPFSAILLAYTLGMWVGGVLNDRLGPTKSCLFGSVLFAVGFAAASWTQGVWTLILSYGLVCGFGIGIAYIAATSNAVRWFPRRRGLAAGCVILGFGLGSLVLAPLKHTLIAGFGWRTAFQLMGAVFLVAGILLALYVRAPRRDVDGGPRQGFHDLSPREMVRTKSFVLIWLAWALCLCAGLGWMAHLPAMTQEAGVSASLAALTLSTVALANGFSRPLVGALADRVGRLTTLLGAAGIFLLLSAFMLLPLEGSWRFFAMGLLFGACFGTFLVNYGPVAAEFYGSRFLGSNMGLLYTSYGMGALTGPALFGALYDGTGSYLPATQLSLLLCAAALGLFYVVKRVRRSEA